MVTSTRALLQPPLLLLLLLLLAVHAAAPPAAAARRRAPPPHAAAGTLAERKQAALQRHISKPFPSVKGAPPSAWGAINVAFARLALHGPTNATVAAEISAEVVAWARMPEYTPWDNYTVTGPVQSKIRAPLFAVRTL